ncbi:hypothetical protein CKC_03730 [Candidatus Liberibacter solanacearum CLso-ZC1]|uniref:Uncharacterized protein n=2 Tax=Candidatus Liberibacter solanacearum TaxID=556287 RepID=E4UBI9_LIBSC|nr:hypothetical protein CKC_03730 [Candidatus Liberibacter solanacearum CLso-ZC1]
MRTWTIEQVEIYRKHHPNGKISFRANIISRTATIPMQ